MCESVSHLVCLVNYNTVNYTCTIVIRETIHLLIFNSNMKALKYVI